MRLPSRPQARAWSLNGVTLICSTSIPASGPPITRAGAGVPVSAHAWLPEWPWAAEAHATDSRTAARQHINAFIATSFDPAANSRAAAYAMTHRAERFMFTLRGPAPTSGRAGKSGSETARDTWGKKGYIGGVAGT